MPQTITFAEQPLGTVNPIYLCKVNRVSFTGTIVNDPSQPTTPVMANNTSLTGPVGITFGNPVDFAQLDVGSLNQLKSTTLYFYNQSGDLITTMSNSALGVEHFTFTPSGSVKIGSVLIASTGNASFSVDNLTFSNTPPLVEMATAGPTGALSAADINGILWGYKWDKASFTYSFPTSESEYIENGYQDITGFLALSTQQENAVAKILADYAAVAPITFTKVTTPAADFRFALAGSMNYSDGTGLHVPGNAPGTAEANPPDPEQATTAWGDNWFSNIAVNPGGNDNTHPVLGNFVYTAAFMHEMGHNLGLKHGHVTQVGHGVTFPKLPADHNSQEYSVMTYNTYPGVQGSTNQYPTTPMIDDIAALQYMYGANYSTQSGNTAYSWDPASGEFKINGVSQGVPGQNHILQTVWDGGGIDTYDLSSYSTNMIIELRPGQWTNLATELADLGAGHFARGNIANAYLFNNNPASLIENVTTGNGHNSVVGNSVANTIVLGTGGQSIAHGLDGNDTITGGGAGNYAFGNGDNDLLHIAGNQNQLFGADGNDWQGVSGNNNALAAGADNDWCGATGSSNTLAGQDGNDALFAAGAGNALYGDAGNDWLGVSGSSNLLFGGAGNDWLGATGDNNRLDGDAGNDTLTAGPGGHQGCTFVFSGGYGLDEIAGFSRHGGGGSDVIDLKGFGFANFAAVQALLADSGANVLLAINPATILTIDGVQTAQLQASDFLLA